MSVGMRTLATILLTCVLTLAACQPGPPATFYQRSNSTFIGAPGNFAP